MVLVLATLGAPLLKLLLLVMMVPDLQLLVLILPLTKVVTRAHLIELLWPTVAVLPLINQLPSLMALLVLLNPENVLTVHLTVLINTLLVL